MPENTGTPSAGRPDRILVVDDEPSILFALEDYFSGNGYRVDCAHSADEALRLLAGRRFDLLIADLRLTGTRDTRGLDLAAFARSACPSMRIIVLTAYGSADAEERARRAGADVFLHKPMPLADLAAVAAGLLAGEGGRAGVA